MADHSPKRPIRGVELKKKTKVSILLPVYKEPITWIMESVRSVLAQTYDNIEVVVMIDTPARKDVSDWLDSLDDSRLSYHVNEANLGLVANLNKGLSLCIGEYVARMDADDISLPERIDKQVCLALDEQCDVVGGNIECFRDDVVLSETSLPCSHEKLVKMIKAGRSIPHPTWLVKRSVFDELQGYRGIPLAEDYDLLVRAVISGYRIGLVQDPVLRYRQNPWGISQTNKGKQKYVTGLVREQIRKGIIYREESICSQINNAQTDIKTYNDCYLFSRSVREALNAHSLKRLFGSLGSFRPAYIAILIRESINGFYAGLL